MGLACFQAIFACHGGKPDTGKLYSFSIGIYGCMWFHLW